MGFLQAYDVQLRYAKQHLDKLAGRTGVNGHDTLLLVEHNPVYTVGLRTEDYGEVEELRLKKLGAEFFKTNRGGLITFHGPGQLVAYPILNLRHFQKSLKNYVATLEQTLINTCRRFGIQARTTEHTGVWVKDKKIAAIGVHCSRYITTHGISLNCDTDLMWFRHIVPCGIPGKDVTSLTRELGKPTSIRDTISPFLQAFEEEFGCELNLTMFDEEDSSLLKTENRSKSPPSGRGGLAEPTGLPNTQYSVRQVSTSATDRAPGNRIPMW